jgi:hypothetical protein
MPRIIELDSLEKAVRAVLFSVCVNDEKPLSLLIVEAGAQRQQFSRSIETIIYLTDCTGYGLTRGILSKIVSGEVKHIMIADLITLLSKSAKTRQSLIAFLNNLIEEGIAKMATYATGWEKEVSCGLITAITEDAL